MMAPKVLKLFFKPAVIAGEKGITNGQPLTATWVICYMCVNVIQALRIKKVYGC